MRFRAIALAGASLVFSACGGGSSGASSGVVPGSGAPSPAPTGTPATASVSFSAQGQATSVQIPNVGGFAITVDFPTVSGTGTVTVTVSTQPFSSVPALSQITDDTNNPQNPPSASAAPLLYVSIASDSAISVAGSPGFTVTPPSTLDQSARRFYFPRLYQQTWTVLNGAAFSSSSGIFTKAIPGHNDMMLGPSGPVNFALAYCGLAHMQLQLNQSVVMGSPSAPSVTIYPSDGLGYPIDGPLSHPIALSISDPSGRTTLQTTSVSNASGPVQLAYSGKGDQFALTARYQSVSASQTFTSTLPNGQALSASSTPYTSAMQEFVMGSDGNFWTPFANGVARVSPSGQFTYFADPDSTHQGPSNSIAEGSDGNVWLFYTVTGGNGIDRVTPSGQFTSFPLNSGPIGLAGSLVRGPDGALYFPSGAGVARIDATGRITTVGNSVSASYIVAGPDNNIWASGNNGAVYKIALNGQVTTYTPAPGNGTLRFIVGPDGNFWAPYAYLTPTLVKFNTQGALVSQTALAYAPVFAAPVWATQTAPGYLSDTVKDAGGNIYISDPRVQGVIRITPSGMYSEYPAASGSQDDPLHLLFENGKLYASYFIPPLSGAGSEQGAIAAIDPSLW